MNGRPLSTRKKFQLLVLLTILVWATQTMLHQWGYGAEIPAGPAAPAGPGPAGRNGATNVPASVEDEPVVTADFEVAESAGPPEKFVPGRERAAAGGTLEMRAEANVRGGEARLKQVCRWSEDDAPVFLPVADLVLTRVDANTQFKSVSLDELKATLRDAGVNMSVVRFAGPTHCTVRRSDAQVNDVAQSLEQWVAARRGDMSVDNMPADRAGGAAAAAPPKTTSPAPVAALAAAAVPASATVTRPAVAADPPAVRTLRSLLLGDLAVRLALPVEQLQVSFNPKDENLLNLSEPQFRFNLDARRVRNLGEVEWEVTVVADAATRKAPVLATARAWQSQVLVNKPLAYRQLLRESDVTERRALVDRLTDEPLLTLPQVVAQQAARDLKPGTVLTARMVDPVALVKPGQLVTVTSTQGSVRVKTVARALEGGSFGQAVHVKNDATNEFYEVVLTAPQEGAVGPAPVPAATPSDAAGLAAAKN